MAETLGSLCDKLTIVKLKQWHSKKIPSGFKVYQNRELQLQNEINLFISNAVLGNILTEQLTFDTNKVYKKREI